MQQLIVATGNAGKLREIASHLPDGIELITQAQAGISGADETGLTFVENAILKARHAASMSGLPAMADDSGLEVDALLGRPGIYSARYAGQNATDADNNQKLLTTLAGIPESERTARFHCVLVLLKHADDPAPLIASGQWEGQILTAPRGENGFGYDPLFYVPGLQRAAAELTPAEKHQYSHRGQALRQLQAAMDKGSGN
ncbi:MAG: RdgB/HAM1 family non-canonical purine NTP pyrophosphatase [Pseudomonadales bacterium]|nr:RdgB/HAM1 family non-canonical purine NTP pyrophosphatase [Pseudomonadales bacterium]